MTGKELKEKILVANVPLNHIAERLGITAQSLNSCFKGKDVRSNTIERIAKVLNVSISSLYGVDKEQNAIATGNGIAVAGNNNVAGNVTMDDNTAVLQERVKFLEQQVKDKESLLEEKERLIKVLMEK